LFSPNNKYLEGYKSSYWGYIIELCNFMNEFMHIYRKVTAVYRKALMVYSALAKKC
jgi:hypothetical protein